MTFLKSVHSFFRQQLEMISCLLVGERVVLPQKNTLIHLLVVTEKNFSVFTLLIQKPVTKSLENF